MAIPRLTTRQVAPTRAPDSRRVDPLREVAAGIGAVAEGVDILGREVERLDDIRVGEAEVQFRERIQQALMDPMDGLMAKKGTQAVEAWDGVRDRLRTAASDVATNLGTDRQRLLFERRVAALSADAERRAGAYVQAETRRVAQQNFEALNAMDAQRIATEAADDEAVTRIMREQDERIALFGADEGMAPAAIQQARTEARQAARIRQVEAVVADNPDYAKVLLARHENTIPPAQRERLTALIDKRELDVRSQQASDNLFAAFGPNDERAAIKEAERQFEGELRDEVVRRVTNAYATERRLRTEAVQARTGELLGKLESGSPLSGADRVWLSENNPTALRAFDVRTRQIANGTAPETLWSKYEEIQDIFATRDAVKIRDLNMAAYRPYLSDGDYRAFSNARRAFLSGQQAALDKPLSQGALVQDALTMAVADGVLSAGITRPSEVKTPEDKRRWQGIVTAIDERLAAAQAAKTDGVLTRPEQMAEVRAVLDDVVIRPSLFGGGQVLPRAAVPEGQRTDTLTTAQRQTFAELRAARRQRAGLAVVPPMTPGMSRRERYLQLVQAGMTAADAEAMVLREMPEPPQ